MSTIGGDRASLTSAIKGKDYDSQETNMYGYKNEMSVEFSRFCIRATVHSADGTADATF